MLDTRVGVAATLIDLPVFNRTNLSRYNVIVMAEGNYDSVTDWRFWNCRSYNNLLHRLILLLFNRNFCGNFNRNL